MDRSHDAAMPTDRLRMIVADDDPLARRVVRDAPQAADSLRLPRPAGSALTIAPSRS
jgi:hypothetical protein